MNKHILIVSQYFFPENFRINDISKEWIKRGYKVTVLTGIPNYPKGKFFKGYGYFKKRKESWNNINIIRLPIIPRLNNALFLGLNYLSFVISGWFWVKFTRFKADLVFNFEVSPMTQALPAIWFGKRKNIPSIIYVQDLWPENLEIVGGVRNRFILKRVNKMVDYIYKHATKILVTSESFKESIVSRGSFVNKCYVWYQYAEDFYQPIKSIYRDKNEILKIVFTGNIGEAQGLEILPKVAKEFNQLNLKGLIKFIIVGDGRNKKSLIGEIMNLEVENYFEFVSAKPANEIPEILSNSDIAFLSFADNELFRKTIPAKLQSYMACGMPILAVVEGETKNIINKSNSGLTSMPNDIIGLKNNIIRFLELNKLELEEYSKNSLKYYKEVFDKNNALDFFDSMMKEVI
jgi:glycosyltransferase involved in cell wall biosynthesis